MPSAIFLRTCGGNAVLAKCPGGPFVVQPDGTLFTVSISKSSVGIGGQSS